MSSPFYASAAVPRVDNGRRDPCVIYGSRRTIELTRRTLNFDKFKNSQTCKSSRNRNAQFRSKTDAWTPLSEYRLSTESPLTVQLVQARSSVDHPSHRSASPLPVTNPGPREPHNRSTAPGEAISRHRTAMAVCDVCVNLSDIMTPQSFSSLVTTLIKYLVYEKQLIPYPYDRLKLYVKKYNELNMEVSPVRRVRRPVHSLPTANVYPSLCVDQTLATSVLNGLFLFFSMMEFQENQCDQNIKYRLASDKYFKKVSDAINALETVFQVISTLFTCLRHSMHIMS